MKKIDVIINRLIEKYQPDAIIVYGSFSDGSENQNSDFDALVIADCEKQHDDSVIENIVLDVFVYPTKTFRDDYDPEEFVQVFDGKIILDKSKTAARLKNGCAIIYPAYRRKRTMRFFRKFPGAKKCCRARSGKTLKGITGGTGSCLTV